MLSSTGLIRGCTTLQRSLKSLYHVAVIGGAGGIGQPLSLLLKNNEQIESLRLYDLANVDGVAMDISHISTRAVASGYTGADRLADCLKDCDMVVIPAGVPRKPGMTRDDLFNMNASIVRDIVTCCAQTCPQAFISIITNPVNSTVPIAFEVFKQFGLVGDNRICGVTTLDVVRAQSFVGRLMGRDPRTVHCDCVCGHSGNTIVPLLSQASPKLSLSEEEESRLVTSIQEAGTAVVNAKAGGGSATLSMAYAGAQFVDNVLRGFAGERNVQCAYVKSSVTRSPYFASPVLFGPGGIEEVKGVGEITPSENTRLEAGIDELIKNIEKGVNFVNS